MSFEYFQELINDYEKLFEINNEHDVIIYAGEGDNVEEIYAHSLILCIRSQYFRAAFSNEWANKEDGKFILKKSNISPQMFKIILRYIYCGKFDLTKLQGPELLELLIAVDELNIQTLIHCIQEYLINNHYTFLQLNPIEILDIIYQVNQHDTFANLWNFFLETICESPEILFNSDFIMLRAPLLELLLKRDDLSSNEIVIWDNLIKWSLAQCPSIQQDVKKWNKEETTIMKKNFHRFIPLIRFYHISSEDFYLKVYPFKVLLPENLINDILAFHMTPDKKVNDIQPPRNPKYDSVIIKSQHFVIFSNWIGKRNDSHYNNIKEIPYSYNLLYRASRDGYSAAAFHNKCDNKGATIVIVKIKGSEQIAGGYNSIDWDSISEYKYVKNNFIFSFTNRKNIETANVGYGNNECTIGCFPDYGPVFSGHFSCLDDGTTWIINSYYSSYYSNIDNIPIGNIKVDDYEVFQIKEKNENGLMFI